MAFRVLIIGGTGQVARELTALIEQRGKSSMIVSDNGTEFTCNAMLAWLEDHQIVWHFIAPGKPMQVSVVFRPRP